MAIRLEEYRSGEYRKGFQYQFFLPSPINESWTWDTPQINRKRRTNHTLPVTTHCR